MEGLLPLVFRTIAGHQRRAEFYRSLSNCDSGRFSRSSSSVSSPHHHTNNNNNNNNMLVTPRALVSDSLDDHLPNNSDLHHRIIISTSAISVSAGAAAAPAPAAVDLRPAVDGHRRPILDTASIQPQGAPQSMNASAAAANLRRFNVINPQPVPLLNPPRASRHAHNQ